MLAEYFGQQAVFVAEIGVHRGILSAHILTYAPRSWLFMVDSWSVYAPNHPYRLSGDSMARLTVAQQKVFKTEAVAVANKFRTRCAILDVESAAAARMLPRSSLDAVFIDADHSEIGVGRDIIAWWPNVKPGGWFGGHDYGTHQHPGVAKVVDAFCQRMTLELTIDKPSSIWYVRKDG